MKKALSLIMALMMLFALSINAAAAPTQYDIVGSVNGNGPDGAHKDTVEDGKSSISGGANASTSVAITATAGQIQHRYAVDITYDTMSFQVAGGELVWDVNDLKYVVNTGAPAKNTGFNLKVTNYSDLPVNMTPALQTGSMSALPSELVTSGNLVIDVYENEFTVDAQGAANVPATGKITNVAQTIDKAEVGTATEYPFSLVISAADWNVVANDYATYFSNNSVTSVNIAELTVTIAAAP